jgi:S-adenosylmethionine hydrolase
MIVLFTDFGAAGPYVGQVKAVLAREAASQPVIDLLHEAPAMNPRAAAYLLAALAPSIKDDAVFVAVVDPGVGTARRALALRADGRWFVGPDNGLLDVVALRAQAVEWWNLPWAPQEVSATFHGRDRRAARPRPARVAIRRWRSATGPWTWPRSCTSTATATPPPGCARGSSGPRWCCARTAAASSR